jgi:thiol-disulfide isomerase/thioredoxin
MITIRIRRWPAAMALAAWIAGAGPLAASPTSSPAQAIVFNRSIVNLESFSGSLQPTVPPSVKHAPPGKPPELLFGEIFRQLPGDPATSREHNIPFAVQLEAGVVVHAWADANLNGDLTDDASPGLSAYPSDPAARSFLTRLRWKVRHQGRIHEVDRLVRVVIDPPSAENTAPEYRIQDVYGMLGQVEIAGAMRRALLFDANSDGLYLRGQGDGMFVDVDDDRQFTIEPMNPDFGPFAISFSMLGRSLSVDSVAADGARITLRDLGPARPVEPPARGRLAPDFSFVDLEGRLQRLSAHRGTPTVVYFWASWCATCRGQAVELERLLAHPGRSSWDLLGVCLDTDRKETLHFRREFGATWPTSFTGGYTTEDPVARLYQEPVVGVFYVVGPDGILADKVTNVEALQAALAKLATPATAGGK